MKSRVLHTVWCNISGEAAGEISVKLNTLGSERVKMGMCLTGRVLISCKFKRVLVKHVASTGSCWRACFDGMFRSVSSIVARKCSVLRAHIDFLIRVSIDISIFIELIETLLHGWTGMADTEPSVAAQQQAEVKQYLPIKEVEFINSNCSPETRQKEAPERQMKHNDFPHCCEVLTRWQFCDYSSMKIYGP